MSSTADDPSNLFDVIDMRADARHIHEIAVDPIDGHIVVFEFGALTFVAFVDGVTTAVDGARTSRLQVELRGFAGHEQVTDTLVAEATQHDIV